MDSIIGFVILLFWFWPYTLAFCATLLVLIYTIKTILKPVCIGIYWLGTGISQLLPRLRSLRLTGIARQIGDKVLFILTILIP
jgi:hypothetical protein